MAELQINCGVTVKLVTEEDAALEVNNNILSGVHSPINLFIQPTGQPIKRSNNQLVKLVKLVKGATSQFHI